MNYQELSALLAQADDHDKSGNYAEAERLAHEVLDGIPALRHTNEVAASDVETLNVHAIVALANAESGNRNYESAVTVAHLALEIATQHNLAECRAIVLNLIGSIYHQCSDYPKSLEYHLKAVEVYTANNNQVGIAKNLANIAVLYTSLADYPMALVYFQKALVLYAELGDYVGISVNFGNQGIVYQNLADYPKALECYQKALGIHQELGNTLGIAGNLHNIGMVYEQLSDYSKALEYYQKAMAINQETHNRDWYARNLGQIGVVYSYLLDYPNALMYLQESMAINEELGITSSVAANLGNCGLVYLNLSDYPMALIYLQKALALNEALGKIDSAAINLINIGSVYMHLADYPKALEYFQKGLVIFENLDRKNLIATSIGNIGITYATPNFDGYNAALAEDYLLKAIALCTEVGAKQHVGEFYKYLAELYEIEERWKESQQNLKHYYAIKDEVLSEEAKKQAILLEQRRQAGEREKHLEIERNRAAEREKILDNILPKEITVRLIKGENPIADYFESVSVFFMDIVDFTPLASAVSAQQLVHLLNAIFKAADGVMREYGLEKIKTIGDAYMAVAGAPLIQEDHAHRAAHAALQLLEVMENLEVTFPDTYGDRSWIESVPNIQVRIGLHCGPVVAGVVGENKFLYDLWGDAVNTASRMESHGLPGKIHCSEAFVQAVGESDFHFTARGEMDIKGKGLMTTYFLEKSI